MPMCRVIWGEDGTPYLLRIYIWDWFRRWLPGVFLHYFFRGDLDRELHNHPWTSAWSLIIWGGYTEERRIDAHGTIRTQVFRPGDVNTITVHDYHRVDMLRKGGGCWTLFVVGNRTQEWGFSERPGHFESITDREKRIAREAKQ
jgi:hypothetical protein